MTMSVRGLETVSDTSSLLSPCGPIRERQLGESAAHVRHGFIRFP
jgi:hypothetical protein